MSQLKHIKKRLIGRFPRLARAYSGFKGDPLANRHPVVTPFGFKFLGNPMMENGDFEKEELGVIQGYIRTSDLIVNIGANIGYYCCMALREGKRLIAVEPDESNLRLLYRNLSVNGWTSGFEVYPLALGAHSGLVELFGGSTGTSLIEGWAGATRDSSRLAPCTTLDLVLGDRLNGKNCFILVDIEGAEHLLLQGASRQLRLAPQATWMIEICVSEHQPNGLRINPNLVSTFEILWQAGYVARTANAARRLVSPEEVRQIAATGYDTLGTHNFVFTSV